MRDTGIVLNRRMCIHSVFVQVALSVIGLDNATKLETYTYKDASEFCILCYIYI